MSEAKHGVAQVVAEASPRGVDGRADAENPAPGLPFEDLAGPADAASPVGKLVDRRKGPGRPAGAQNRMTKDIRKLILAQHKHPLLVLAEVYSLPVDELASVLGCKPIEALDRQIKAAAELAPYLTAKQAAVDDAGQVVLPVLHLNFGSAAPAPVEAAKEGGTLSILDLVQAQQNQWVSADAGEPSHADASHDQGQAIDAEGESDA